MKTVFSSLVLLLTFSQIQSARADQWSGINGGWQGIYREVGNQLDRNRNYIIWSIIAPKDPLDLRKPDFFREFLAHSSGGLSISHNYIGWSCQVRGRRYEGATGMSGESSEQSKALVKAGWGLTTFLAIYNDGWLATSTEAADDWAIRRQREEIYNVVVEVSEQECDNMLSFMHTFVTSPRKPWTKFGLTPSVEKLQGGGCITFVTTLLKKAGILKSMINSSSRTLYANPYGFGGNDLPKPAGTWLPRLAWREGKPKKVGINQFFSSNWNGGLKAVSLTLLDPEVMIWGIKNLSPSLAVPRKVQKYPQDGCRPAEGDCGGYRKVAIDNKFDNKAAAAASAARSWKQGLLAKGYKMRVLTRSGSPFVIFTR